MNANLIELLSKITEEEQKILDGNDIDRRIYTKSGRFIIDSQKMLSAGHLIDIRPHTRFVRFPRHTHNYIEIIYMCSGQTTHIVNDTNEVVLSAGNLLFFNQYSSHEILPAGVNDLAVNFIILPEFFDIALGMVDSDSIIGAFLVSTLCNNDHVGHYLHYQVADIVPIQNLIENLVWSIAKGPGSNRMNETTMGLLLMHLMTCTERLDRNDPNQYENRLIMRSLEYIEANYKTATLGELSQLTGQSIYKLSRLLKAGTGLTYKELLLQKRLQRSTELLTQTSLPVTDIIYSVGYDNTSYFYRVFREKYGKSPLEYRQKNRTELCK